MALVCKLDGSVHETVESLHAVLKRFRIKQADYWHDAAPRYNPYTKQLIVYKTYDQYMTQDFDDIDQIKAWIKTDPQSAREWALGWLKRRKEDKMLTYAPSQVELRTLLSPTMAYYDSIGGYYNLTKAMGYQERYDMQQLQFKSFPQDMQIIQDTREQNPLKLAAKTVVSKVDCGDYALAAPYDEGIYVERKSLADFCGTMSKGNARFRRELERATKRGHYIVMLVEASIQTVQGFPCLSDTRHIRAQPAFIFKQMRDLLTDFPFSFQVVFVDGRLEAARQIIRIFQLGNQVKTTDLQYAVEQGRL
jgi:hypothetical protein